MNATDKFVNLFLVYGLIITGGNLIHAIEYTIAGFLKGAAILCFLVFTGFLVCKSGLVRYFG